MLTRRDMMNIVKFETVIFRLDPRFFCCGQVTQPNIAAVPTLTYLVSEWRDHQDLSMRKRGSRNLTVSMMIAPLCILNYYNELRKGTNMAKLIIAVNQRLESSGDEGESPDERDFEIEFDFEQSAEYVVCVIDNKPDCYIKRSELMAVLLI